MSFLVRLPIDLYDDDAFIGYKPGSFSLVNARAAMWLAQLSYEDQPDKQDLILKKWGLQRITSFNRPFPSLLPMSSTGGFVARDADTVFVVFEGTDPLLVANWVSDFNFAPNKLGIHQGFSEALDAAWDDLKVALDKAKPFSRLVISGHSLGAALAGLCADRASSELKIMPETVHAFGMPRVGTLGFAAAYNERLGNRTYRLVHGHDIVATVPPTESGFRHVGRYLACASEQRFADTAQAMTVIDEPPFVETVLNGTRAGLRDLLFGRAPRPISPSPVIQASNLLPPGLADHLPDRYWRALKSR